MLSKLNEIISAVLRERGRDHRSCFTFVYVARPDASGIILECSDAEILKELETAARAALGEAGHNIQTVLLPDPGLSLPRVMVGTATAADVRREPDTSSERVSQIILGASVQPLKETGGWFLVRCDDGYIGWIHGRDLTAVTRFDLDDFLKKASSRVSVLKTSIYSEQRETSPPLAEALMGTLMIVSPGGKRGWRAVRLAGGRSGFARARHLEPIPTGRRISRPALAATGFKLLGIPYLWGGTSTRGFDCSGLVQTIYRLHGLVLPRDSDVQAECGKRKRPGSIEALRTGDLLFFGKQEAPISHVGLYISNGLFLHASGQVRVSSMAADHPLYESKLAAQWRFTQDLISPVKT